MKIARDAYISIDIQAHVIDPVIVRSTDRIDPQEIPVVVILGHISIAGIDRSNADAGSQSTAEIDCIIEGASDIDIPVSVQRHSLAIIQAAASKVPRPDQVSERIIFRQEDVVAAVGNQVHNAGRSAEVSRPGVEIACYVYVAG